VEVDLHVLRGERAPELTLFGEPPQIDSRSFASSST
jgi:hypothetical protein